MPKFSWMSMSSFLLLSASTLGAVSPDSAARHYSVILLPTLGGTSIQAFGLNNRGQVTGTAAIAGDTANHPFLYSNGKIQDLGTLGGISGCGFAVNDRGQVTGGDGLGLTRRAFIFSGGVMKDLGIQNEISAGLSINAFGRVAGLAGTVDDTGPHIRAVIFGGGAIQDLGTLGGGESAGVNEARGINDRGQVTGFAVTGGDNTQGHAFLFTDGSVMDLGTLGGTSSSGSTLNNRGQVVGTSTLMGNLAEHAFLYHNGFMKDLGTLGGSNSFGMAVNIHGVVTGGAAIASEAEHAFVDSGGRMRDLNDEIGSSASLYTLVEGEAINDKGQIVVNGIVNETNTQAAFLLTPVL